MCLEAMEDKGTMEKLDEIMLPGFRFHPTDEELVGFYLRRKIQQKPLSIELIKQLEIYKYDPWDLPKLATTGEKEWYFYCPRDRKYRNSARPNRVTSAGFWKATGTDRPIYSSEEAKCIGLKKSLVFYKGRAAKGVKTDWMMHEFRLPSFNDPSFSKRPLDKNLIPANESWAICRIFKKTNTSAQRALSHPWGSLLPEATGFDKNYLSHSFNGAHFGSENIQFGCGSGLEQHSTALTYPSYDITSFKPASFMFSPPDQTSLDSKPSVDMASILAALQDAEKPSPSTGFGQQHSSGFTVTYPLEANTRNLGAEEEEEEEAMVGKIKTNCSITFDSSAQWEGMRNVSFPFNLAPNSSEEWKLNLPWEPAVCQSDMSTGYSTNRV